MQNLEILTFDFKLQKETIFSASNRTTSHEIIICLPPKLQLSIMVSVKKLSKFLC